MIHGLCVFAPPVRKKHAISYVTTYYDVAQTAVASDISATNPNTERLKSEHRLADAVPVPSVKVPWHELPGCVIPVRL